MVQGLQFGVPTAVLMLAFGSAPGHAASFNCSHAALPAEVTICGDAQLNRLDEQSAGLYYLIVASGAPASTIREVKSQQGRFLAQRNGCGTNYNCLIDAYTSQIMYLKNIKGNLGL
jgi:uncharacterized protein